LALTIDNLSKHYRRGDGRVEALRQVSLSVSPGEFVAVQGPSGCGKTTLLLAAGGLLAPDGGSVAIDGQDPYDLNPDDRAAFRARKIGFVFQRFHLVPYLSVRDNVLVASLGRPSEEAPQRATELIGRFGLTDRASHVPAELSVGERQRAALARAMLNSPKLLLADEPTGNLDPANAEIVLAALAGFAEQGGGVLLVTHDPAATQIVHRTIRLQAGRIIDD